MTEYVIVPKEPDDHQLRAAQKEWLADPERKSSTLYRAMISAAPDPLQDEALVERVKKAITDIIGEHYGDYDDRITRAAIAAMKEGV